MLPIILGAIAIGATGYGIKKYIECKNKLNILSKPQLISNQTNKLILR
jgi:hypothetical protein